MELVSYMFGNKAEAFFLVVLILFLLSYSASAWPNETQWNPILNETGMNMTDITTDAGTGGGNNEWEIVGNNSYPAAYMFNNGTHLFFRMRLGKDPQAGKTYLSSGRWVVVMDTDGNLNDYEYGIVAQVVSKINYVYIVQNTIKGGLGDPSDQWETTLKNYTGNVNVSTAPSTILGTPDYFIDWFVPYDDFLTYTNTTNQSVLKLILGTGGGVAEKIDKDIGGTSLVPGAVGTYLNNTVSAPVSPMGTMLTNGSVAFVNSSYQSSVISINVSDRIYVRLNDSDKNTDKTKNDTVNVRLLTETGDNETLTLNETNVSAGIFTGYIDSNYSAINIVGNGKLEVIHGLRFNVTYNDTTKNGNYTNRIDNASVKPLINISYSSTVDYGSSSNLTINISDIHPNSYIVYENDTNIANGSYSNGVSFNVSINTSVVTTWNYTAWANDTNENNTNSTTVWITIIPDTTNPTISYNTPPTAVNNSVVNDNFFTVDVTAYDLNLKNITINLYNKSTGNLLNSQVSSGVPPSTYTFQIIFSGLSNGDYLFNATAYDTSGNSNTTAARNVTVLSTGGPDLTLTSQNITFVYDAGEASEVTEAGEARENINLTINATIYNGGTSSSGAFYVLFYDGSSMFYNVSMTSIAVGVSANATAYWTTLVGTHNITIRVDPNGVTGDTDRSNNNASKLINVSAWQKYYGNATGNYMLANYLSTSMRNWTWNNETNIGYLYVVNQSASINWSALHPLGYNKNNAANSSGQDFRDADTNLGMVAGTGNATGFQNNNITDLFTNTTGSNYGNVAINTTSFVIFGNTINNVPVVNSTDMTNHNAVGSANFITGILWDDTKDSNGYYDTSDNENLVFITKIRQAASGLKGTAHNYEIAVPYSLNSITGGDVDMYMELT